MEFDIPDPPPSMEFSIIFFFLNEGFPYLILIFLVHDFFSLLWNIFAQKDFKFKDGFPFDLDGHIKVDLSKSTR